LFLSSRPGVLVEKLASELIRTALVLSMLPRNNALRRLNGTSQKAQWARDRDSILSI
jgi:hypothetical protein